MSMVFGYISLNNMIYVQIQQVVTCTFANNTIINHMEKAINYS